MFTRAVESATAKRYQLTVDNKNGFMELDPNKLAPREIYHWLIGLINPRPIAWVSTISAAGVANLAPYSFFNGVGSNPPLVMFCPANRRDGSAKDTLANIQSTGQFVVNVVTDQFAEAMKQTAGEYTPDEDEFELAEIDKAPSRVIRPPRVANVDAAMECTLHQAMQLGVGPGGANLVIGRIVNFFIADHLVTDDGKLAAERLKTIGRMGGAGYVHTDQRFEL